MLERAVLLTWFDVAHPVSNVRRYAIGRNFRIATFLLNLSAQGGRLGILRIRPDLQALIIDCQSDAEHKWPILSTGTFSFISDIQIRCGSASSVTS
jgi:hypothetical protein